MSREKLFLRMIGTICIMAIFLPYWFSEKQVFAASPKIEPTEQPIVIDDTGVVISWGSIQQDSPSDLVQSTSVMNILCFSTQTYDPCLRVKSIFTNVTVIHSAASLPANLSGYNAVYIGYGEGNLLNSRASQFASYVYAGGGLVVTQPNLEGEVKVYPPGFEMTVSSVTWPEFPNYPGPVEFTAAGTNHPILSGISPADLSGNFDTIPISTVGPAWTILSKAIGYPNIALLAGNYGEGKLIFHTGNISSASIDPGSNTYVRNLIEWAGTKNTLGPDMKISAIEVTQAVQDLNNSVDLIANKRTFVRVHITSPKLINNVTANLSAETDYASLIPVLIPKNPGAVISARTSPDRGKINDSFWFELPDSWLGEGNLKLTARLDPSNTKGDPQLANNTSSVTVNFKKTPPMRLKIINVPYKIGTTTYQASSIHFDMLESWLRRAYPISKLEVTRETFTYVGVGVPNADLLNARLGLARTFDMVFSGVDSRIVYYGMVDDGGGFMRGKAAGIPSSTAAGPTGTRNWGWDNDGSYGDWYGGHEIAHTRNRYHAEFCGAGGGAAFPYTDGQISPTTSGLTALYGFDAENQAIYSPNWHDLMTYCTNEWLSDFTYEGIRNYLVSAEGSPQRAQTEAMGDEFLVISGVADLSNNTAVLDEVYLIDQAISLPLPTPGSWSIVLRNASGAMLATYPFMPQELSDNEGSSNRPAVISEIVPAVADFTKVEIVSNSVIVATRTISANTPTVFITAPEIGQNLGSGKFTFSWTASDLDDDPLTSSILYSYDNGNNWETISTGITEQNLEINTPDFPGGSTCYIKVIVSDGIRTGMAVSGPFTVPEHNPLVKISSPKSDASFYPVQLIVFQGNAYDLEDGQLTGASLQWFSDKDGLIGTGELLSTVNLSTGTHWITLRATDSGTQTAEAKLKIVISNDPIMKYRVLLPSIR